MTDTTPIKAIRTGAEITALGEFAAGEVIPVAHGGTGATTAEEARLALGVDPAGAASGAVTAHEAAYDHDAFLTAESDPVFSAWDRSTGITITESQISDLGEYEPADTTILKSSAIGVTVCSHSDARLSDARTPTAHKSSHSAGGSDALTPSDIGAATAGHLHTGVYEPAGAVSTHESTYSHSLIASALQPAAIDDTSTASDKLWSAQKISSELGDISAALDALNGEAV